MTKTQDELKAAVERIERDLSFADATAKKHGGTVYRSMFSVSDLRLIIAALRSPDPEVERLRGANRNAGEMIGNMIFNIGQRAQLPYDNASIIRSLKGVEAALSSNSGGR